jgi:hypothetical protein
MGNQSSSTNKEQNNSSQLKAKPIGQILDYIASYYIITMDFKSLKELYKTEYCNKLVILTSDIVERYFTDLEISYLAQRVKNGEQVNEMKKDKIIFFDKDSVGNLDIKNSVKKKQLCISIAKFYIKIAHLFAAIVTTINPIYVYKDAEGNTMRADLYDKGKIPVNTPRQIYRMNICDNRINALKNGQSLEPDENGDITILPKVCSSNIGDTETLAAEPGIPELMELYYDQYNERTNEFDDMSKEARSLFLQDLQIFYNVFTDNNGKLPEGYTKFSDIQLRNYHKQCQGPNPKLETAVKGPLSNNMFASYANMLKKMMTNANANQQALLQIINDLFEYTVDPQTQKKQIRVNHLLTEKFLQDIIIKARSLIINLYLTCEADYENVLKIYEAIVETKIFDTVQRQYKNVKSKINAPVVVPVKTELLKREMVNESTMDPIV